MTRQTMRFTTARHDLEQAAMLLRDGETVAFPTETVYGLGANALDARAVDKIFKAKGRPSDNPLIVHIAHRDDVHQLVTHIPELARLCMDHFWPGPLTLILPCTDAVPANVTAGLDTVGVRMPDHDTALQVIALAGVPVAAPSANRSGRPSPTTAEHVLEDLSGHIAGVVDGGAAGVGVESTVLDVTGAVPMILRPGGVTREMLEHLLGPVAVDPALGNETIAPKSPGVKYTHYAPRGTMYLVEGEQALVEMQRLVQTADQKVGVLTTDEHKDLFPTAAHVISLGSQDDLATVAARLYDAIRSFDHHEIEVIYAETFPEDGIGLAVMNRLRKAAGHRVILAE
ncbi:L-threonylcarbamoyladenylate synthase [Tumebacillus permanentifrigoris]|uniref:Threonylcarbamoyl-AMP synthase n=1 Tax=Tumebacillus permanentifrigoris TaxID=378543 RepID=A0A316DDI0_9BACL|nr:L-threonylcarbamoyladenylate synthase [Tumebacillus permanentifrigoris]PWK16287.1 translation factor SUA5 [Tumebacillus permanentifrigoris]